MTGRSTGVSAAWYWCGLLALLVALAALSWASLDQNAKAERAAVDASARQLLDLSVRVLAANLQDSNFEEIEPYLNQLGAANRDIVLLHLVGADGTELGRFSRPAQAGPRLHLEAPIRYAYRGLARFSLELDLSGVERRRERLLWQSGGIFAILSGLLAALVHFALRLREDTRALRRRGEELEAARARTTASETRLRELNRTLTVLRRCTEALVRARDEQELLDATCALAVERGGYALAWIGMAEGGPRRRIVVAAAAGKTRYLEGITLSWADAQEGQGPTGRAIRTGVPVWIRDTQSDPTFAPWRERAAAFGIRSSIALPIGTGLPAGGVLCLYATQPNPYSDEELALLGELAQDISYGLQALRGREALRESNERLRQITENIREVFWITDAVDGRLLYVSPAFETIWQRSLSELYADPWLWRAAVHPEDQVRVRAPDGDIVASGEYDEEYRIVRSDGSLRWIRERAFAVFDKSGRMVRVAGTAEDITERKAAQARLEFQANHDLLTGLANRRLLGVALERLVATALTDGLAVAVAVLDLDRFKFVNDSLGHEGGDALLCLIAERLRECVAPGDLVARVGGDEFVVVLGGRKQDDALASLALLQKVISRPYRIGETEVAMSCSIGVAFAPLHGSDLRLLLRRADAAMYNAKDLGRNTIHTFSDALDRRITERLQLESSLRDAVRRGEFVLAYQAKVDAETHAVVGAEALIRWNHPELGLIGPARFIPIAEETEVILGIGAWAIQTACAQMQAWQAEGVPRIPISVNLSARQFKDPLLVNRIQESLLQTGLPASCLDLEITESLIMEDTEEALLTLRRLKALGLQLSVDDFGTGYSNFSYLKRFQPDRLKIDRSLVANLPEDARDATIATAIIALGHALEMAVVAEGVESPAQLDFLRRHGCDEVQGYLFGRPQFAEAFGPLLRGGHLQPVAPDA